MEVQGSLEGACPNGVALVGYISPVGIDGLTSLDVPFSDVWVAN